MRPRADTLNGLALTATAAIAFTAAVMLRIAAADPRARRFFVAFTAGVGFVALDEVVGIHETAGHNLRFLADVPGVTHPDDLIFAAYGVIALAFLALFRDVVFSSRSAAALFAAGLLTFGAAAGFDVLDVAKLEERTEPLATVFVLFGITTLAARQLARALAV